MRFRSRVAINLVLASLVPLLLAMGVALWMSKEQILELSLDRATGRLEAAAYRLDSYFAVRKSQVAAYARLPAFKQKPFHELLPFLREEVVQHKGTYEKFILSDSTSHFLNTVGGNPHQGFIQTFDNKKPDAKPKSIRKRDYWQRTVGYNLDAKPVVYVSNPMISYTTGVKQIVVTATILDDHGLVKGLIGGSLPWESFEGLVADIRLGLASMYHGTGFALVSNDGTYWSHWNPDKVISLKKDAQGKIIKDDIGEAAVITRNVLQEQNQQVAGVGKDLANNIRGYQIVENAESGERDYYIYTPINSSAYGLIMVIPEDELLAPVNQMLILLASLLAGAVLLVLFLSFDLASRLGEPLNRLKNAAFAFRDGGQTNFNLESNIVEFKELGNVLRSMAATIQQKSQDLVTSEERFSLAMKGSSDGLWDWNLLTDEVFFSDRWKAMLGYSFDDIDHTLTAYEQLIHPEDREAVFKTLQQYLNDERGFFEAEFRMLHKRQHYIFVLSRGYAVRDSKGQAIRMVGTHVDITDRKAQEQEILGTNEVLEQRVRERTEQLDKLNSDLRRAKIIAEEASQAKSQFLANISHELRTPLNAIFGMTELCTRTSLEPDQLNYVNKIQEAARTLLTLIDNVIQVAEVEAGNLELEHEKISLAKLVDLIQREYSPFALSKSLEFYCKPANEFDCFYGDLEKIYKVLASIVENAIKFTERGRVSIEFRLSSLKSISRSTNSSATVASPIHRNEGVEDKVALIAEIRDTGKGIPRDKIKTLFEMFNQEDNSSTRVHMGTGIGLALAKRLVDHMGGTIDVKSEEGVGSSFTVKLNVSSHAEGVKTRTLVLGEYDTNLQLLMSILEQAGITCVSVGTKEKAQRLLNDEKFDLVLISKRALDVDVDLVQELLPQDNENQIKAILIADDAKIDVAEKLSTLGFVDYVEHPIEVDDLLHKVKKWSNT